VLAGLGVAAGAIGSVAIANGVGGAGVVGSDATIATP